MLDRKSPGGNTVGEHNLQQLRPGRREQISRLFAQRLLKEFCCGQYHAILTNEPAQTAAVSIEGQGGTAVRPCSTPLNLASERARAKGLREGCP